MVQRPGSFVVRCLTEKSPESCFVYGSRVYLVGMPTKNNLILCGSPCSRQNKERKNWLASPGAAQDVPPKTAENLRRLKPQPIDTQASLSNQRAVQAFVHLLHGYNYME